MLFALAVSFFLNSLFSRLAFLRIDIWQPAYRSEINDMYIDGWEKDENMLNYMSNLGRFGKEEELAGTVLYLASKGGAVCPGAVVLIDGGTLVTQPSTY